MPDGHCVHRTHSSLSSASVLHPGHIKALSSLVSIVGLMRRRWWTRRLRRFCFNDFKSSLIFFSALSVFLVYFLPLHTAIFLFFPFTSTLGHNIDLGFVGRYYIVYVLDPFSANTARVYTHWRFTFISDHSFSVRYFLLKEVKEPRGFQTPMFTNGPMSYQFYWRWVGAFCKTVEPVFSELVDLEDSGSSVTVDDSFNLK